MSTISADPSAPLSRRSNPAALTRLYRGAGREQRQACDQDLLARLASECGARQVVVGQLPEKVLHQIVEDVETEHYGVWRLAGDDDDGPIAERLDAHFAPLQAAWLEQRAQENAQAAAREHDAAVQRLRWTLGMIGAEREALRVAEARLTALESEAAAEAQRLGFPLP